VMIMREVIAPTMNNQEPVMLNTANKIEIV